MTNTPNGPTKLTLEQRLAVACYHSIFAKWVVDSTHGHSVCCHCGKPSPEAVIRICSECESEFVMPFDWKWQPKMIVLSNGQLVANEFVCPQCYLS